MRFHDLRHSYAVASIKNGDDIVLRGSNRAGMHLGGAFGQLLHHLLLQCRGLCDLGVVDGGGRGKVKLVGGLDVRRLPKQVHQLRQVEELGKARPRPVARTLGIEFVKILFVDFLN